VPSPAKSLNQTDGSSQLRVGMKTSRYAKVVRVVGTTSTLRSGRPTQLCFLGVVFRVFLALLGRRHQNVGAHAALIMNLQAVHISGTLGRWRVALLVPRWPLNLRNVHRKKGFEFLLVMRLDTCLIDISSERLIKKS